MEGVRIATGRGEARGLPGATEANLRKPGGASRGREDGEILRVREVDLVVDC